MAAAGMVEALRSGSWLRRGRVMGYCRLFLFVEAAAVAAGLLLSTGGVDPQNRPLGTDFLSFYVAGLSAAAGTAAAAYDPAAHYAAEHAFLGFDDKLYYAFFYPPPFLALCRLLAALPYVVSLALWQGGTALLYGAGLRAIRPLPGTLLVGFAFPACFLCLGHGQTAFLTAGLWATGTALLDRRPAAAGALLGALCFKPHLALLLPVALVAGRRWRALAGAAAAAAALAGLATLALGPAIWPAYVAAMPGARATFEGGGVEFWKMAAFFGAVRSAGGSVGAASMIQAVAAAAAFGAVASLWWRRVTPGAPAAAALVAGSFVASPLVLDYDLVAMAVAATWLVSGAEREGFLPWQRSLLAVLFAVPLISRPFGAAAGIPLATLVAPSLLVLASIQSRQGRAGAPSPTPIERPNLSEDSFRDS
jgi:hypothetical protein